MRAVRLTVGRYRTRLTVGLLLLAIWLAVRAALPAPTETVALPVAAQDLPAGHRITADDLSMVRRPRTQAPPGLTPAVGRILAAPVRAGEAITDTRLLGPGLLRALPTGSVAVPVRLSDPAGAALVRPGDRVDVVASTAASWSSTESGTSTSLSPATTRRAARDALVLGVPAGDEAAGLLVLAVQQSETDALLGATAGAQVSVVILP